MRAPGGALGYGTVVMQAGEDDGLDRGLDCGDRAMDQARDTAGGDVEPGRARRGRTSACGVKRAPTAICFALKLRTKRCFASIHPQRRVAAADRLTLLTTDSRALGYEAGGGVMVGIPGQSFESLAEDILAFRALDLDMIGIGPYIAHPATPLGSGALRPPIASDGPGSEQRRDGLQDDCAGAHRCPNANIPSTTALATINKANGRKAGSAVGANVVMPNLTPVKYRSLYQIYPAKACIDESATDCNQCLRGQIRSLGRFPGSGPGGRGAVGANEMQANALLPAPLRRLCSCRV